MKRSGRSGEERFFLAKNKWQDLIYTCQICSGTFSTRERAIFHLYEWEACADCAPEVRRIEEVKAKRKVKRSGYED